MTVRMVRAELLKHWKKTGTVITTLVLTVGIAIVIVGVPEIYHLTHRFTSSVGGHQGLTRGSVALGFLASVAGLIVGSAAGTVDTSSGIFRDLVATGRSRWSLFGAKIPGALLFFVPIVTLAFVIMALLDIAFSSHGLVCPSLGCFPSGGGPFSPLAPASGLVIDWYLWVLLSSCFDLLIALGLSSLVSSRATTIGLLLPIQFIVSPLLSGVTQLGGSRQAFFTQSLSLLSPRGINSGIQMFGQPVTYSLSMAWFVLVVWVVVLLGVGAWRTATRDA